MQYFFQIGSQTDLCYAELLTCLRFLSNKDYKIKKFGADIVTIDFSNLKAESEEELSLRNELSQIFKHLGGSIRFGVMIDDQEDYLDAIKEKYKSKIIFGITAFGVFSTLKEVDKFAKKIKERYIEEGMSVRFISPKIENKYEGKTNLLLNSAQVDKNRLLKKGFELVIFSDGEDVRMGSTIDIQDYEQFSIIDYEKPRSDKKMGMLPPKLARIMVNLSGVGFSPQNVIWDPFCGSGGILLQAMITGRSVLGSDVDKWAIRNSEQNIDWLVQTHPEFGNFADVRYKTFPLDITDIPQNIAKLMKNSSIDAVVCEPYMGPPQRRPMARSKAVLLSNGVVEQYGALLQFLERIGKKGLRVVLIVPIYKTYEGWYSFYVNELIHKKQWKIVNKNLHWERKTSIIRRHIMILELIR